jgi:transcriptional regulator with XRE-family HTH domain
MISDRYDPVPFDVEATHRRWMRDLKFGEAYDALEDEYAALNELLRARKAADMTQADVAERMGIAQASVARLESSAGSRKHAPSLATLRRYADAVGCDLRITLTAKQGRKRKPAGAKKARAEPAAQPLRKRA